MIDWMAIGWAVICLLPVAGMFIGWEYLKMKYRQKKLDKTFQDVV